MAETFSIGEALAAPVRVIRRHPLAVFVWGLTMVLFSLALSALVFGSLADLPLTQAGSAEPPPEFLGRMMAFQGVSMLANLGQVALSIIIWTATMRATLRIGRPDRYFFMRAGMDELRVGVVGVALFFGAYIAVIVLVLLGVAIGAVAWQANEALAILLGFLMMLGLIAAVIYAMARLSLIAPATLILERFAFVEGWNLAKGRVGSLLGLLICTWLIYMAIYLVIAFFAILAVFASGVFAHMQAVEQAVTFRDLMPPPGVIAGLVVVLIGPGAFLYGAVMTLLCAPFASACRQLLDGSPQGALEA
ncbi:hypothetical protein [Brevundimonas sp.]|uniref:hypothetical protein n=1 Tax=Brevundimonas sp. TaxID=1871086 RepID=UPI0019A7AFD3|nr:hypothetical protein [Brevundimonas sp.]MBD3835623.1 hypothetical protein [Brevundimonas sp.]